MHSISDGVIRLRDEILALREGRCGFLADLEQETRDRRVEVSRTLAQFSKDFAAAARGTKADRQFMLSGIKRAVSDLRSGVRADLGHAQQAFVNLKSPLGDTFRGRKHVHKPAPPFSAKGEEKQYGFEVETKDGRAGEPKNGKRAGDKGKRRTSSRRRR
ncbi:MAG: hypothetical protein ABSB82_18305 [Terriglobia bacterium]|jgi:hypothetical protein